MNRPETVAQLLNAFGVASDKPLGAGQESDVFAIDDRRVLRLYRRPCDERHLAPTGDLLRSARPLRRTIHGSGNYGSSASAMASPMPSKCA
jgi:hypothetical protein